MTDLLNCPFCGCKADMIDENLDYPYMVYCRECRASTQNFSTYEEAEYSWNVRVSGWIKVKEIHYFKNTSYHYPLSCLLENDIIGSHALDGKVIWGGDEYDLFMASTKKKLWVAIHRKESSHGKYHVTSNATYTKEDLIKHLESPHNWHFIEIEVEE